MIERYQRKEMMNIWNDQTKFTQFLTIELENLKAENKLGLFDDETLSRILENATFRLEDIKAYEEITKHDVIAFTKAVSDHLGEDKKWFHYGLTSTDVVDSAQALQLKRANDILCTDIEKLEKTLKEKALQYKYTLIIGRTHGMHAEVTSFGLKWLLWLDELLRAKKYFLMARKEVETIKLSGAVGNYSDISPKIEEMVASSLGVDYAIISTQVLSRDRHARYIESLVGVSNLLEKIALEIRNLSRQEVHEVEEAFSNGQKGSSAMPHKRNPITSENICGCGRVMRSYINVCLEDNLLWHERDISHSSAERIVLADATSLLDYMLVRYEKLLRNLVVFEDKMKEDIFLTKGVCFSNVFLRKMIEKGQDRFTTYDILQKCAFACLSGNTTFEEEVSASTIKDFLTKEEIHACFSPEEALKNIDVIYKRMML
jgi:adenylosuccinate lyase